MPAFDALSEEQKWATAPTFRGLPLLELSGQTMLRAACGSSSVGMDGVTKVQYKLSHEFNREALSSLWETHLVDMIGFDNIQHDLPRCQIVPVALYASVFGENYSQVPGCFVQDMIVSCSSHQEWKNLLLKPDLVKQLRISTLNKPWLKFWGGSSPESHFMCYSHMLTGSH